MAQKPQRQMSALTNKSDLPMAVKCNGCELQEKKEKTGIDKAIDEWITSNCYPIGENIPALHKIISIVENTARRFYELGLKSKE